MGYFNNSNRNLTEAYQETLKEQESLNDRLLCEEMGRETTDNLRTISNTLIRLKTDIEKYYDEIRATYDFDEEDEMIKVPKKSLSFVKNLYDKLLGGKE